MERHGGCLHRQPDEDRREHETAGETGAGERGLLGELDHVEGMRIRGDVEADEPHQQGQGAEKGVEEELERRAGGVAVAPAGDHEVHPDDGQVEE